MKTEEYLKKNALWIIMDPWYPTPYKHDLDRCPHIDDLNKIVLDKIIDYLSEVKHKCISCEEYSTDGKKIHVHNEVSHLFDLKNNYSTLEFMMNVHQLRNIVYCGFHYGQCILNKPDGAINTSKKFTTWVKKDLCCLFPGDMSPEEADSITSKYATII